MPTCTNGCGMQTIPHAAIQATQIVRDLGVSGTLSLAAASTLAVRRQRAGGKRLRHPRPATNQSPTSTR